MSDTDYRLLYSEGDMAWNVLKEIGNCEMRIVCSCEDEDDAKTILLALGLFDSLVDTGTLLAYNVTIKQPKTKKPKVVTQETLEEKKND
jgi:hypothetical protein